MQQDYFGFLKYSDTIMFNDGEVSVKEDYKEAYQWIEQYLNQDGFIYPPESCKVKLEPVTLKKIQEIPNTKKTALLYKLPASHKIKESDAAFIIHLISYLFGTRLQFEEWWFDGRVPITPTVNFGFSHETLEHFISHSYDKWKGFDSKQKKLMTNVLVMFSRAPSYNWDWEQFIIEYMVFEGIYEIAATLFKLKDKVSHSDRFGCLCELFNLKRDNEKINEIYKMRNELFHTTLWDDKQPCSSTGKAFKMPFLLRKFNTRLIPALLGYNNKFVKTDWWIMGRHRFDKLN